MCLSTSLCAPTEPEYGQPTCTVAESWFVSHTHGADGGWTLDAASLALWVTPPAAPITAGAASGFRGSSMSSRSIWRCRPSLLRQIAKEDLLILDDFGLTPLPEQIKRDLLEIPRMVESAGQHRGKTLRLPTT